MADWLTRFISEKLEAAFEWKKLKDQGIKTEAARLYSDDGSNIRAQVPDTIKLIQICKWQGSALILADGSTCAQARITTAARQRFESKHSRSLESLTGTWIRLTSFEITATHLGPPSGRIQLIIHGLEVPPVSAPFPKAAQDPIYIHKTQDVKGFLRQLAHYRDPGTFDAPVTIQAQSVEPQLTQSPSMHDRNQAPEDVDLIEVTRDAWQGTPRKRPHSALSPTRPSPSSRSVKPRREEDDDVIIQTGINLVQPKQIAVSNTQQEKSSNLLALLSKGARSNVSASTDAAQALRLGGMASNQMPPPPVPPNSESESQSQAMSTQVNVPFAVPPPAPTHLFPPDEALASQTGFESQVPHQQRVSSDVPNNTPTSFQPELVVETSQPPPQASLPQIPPPLPPSQMVPSQPTGQISSATSSSHLLEKTSSSLPHPQEGAPPALWIKYARKKIPDDQRRLLERPESWLPSRPGMTFPHPNIPASILQRLDQAVRQRTAAAHQSRVPSTPATPEPVTHDSSQAYSWSSSPAQRTPPFRSHLNTTRLPAAGTPVTRPPFRSRLDTQRRSTNLPPDSSAEDDAQHRQEPQQNIDMSSSPPEPSLSESDDSDVDMVDGLELDRSIRANPRQLPEFSLSSPESTAKIVPEASQQTQPVTRSTKREHGEVSSLPERPQPSQPIIDQVQAAPLDAGQMHAAPSQNQTTASLGHVTDTDRVCMANESTVSKQVAAEDDVSRANLATDLSNMPPSTIPESSIQPRVEVEETPRRPPRIPSRKSRGFEFDEPPADSRAELYKRKKLEFMLREREKRQVARTADAGGTLDVPSPIDPDAIDLSEAPILATQTEKQSLDLASISPPASPAPIPVTEQEKVVNQLQRIIDERRASSQVQKEKDTSSAGHEASQEQVVLGATLTELRDANTEVPAEAPAEPSASIEQVPYSSKASHGTLRMESDFNARTKLLALDSLFRELSKKRLYKGNRKAFENSCKKLYREYNSAQAPIIPREHWDNYVVLRPAEYLPYNQRMEANGEDSMSYDQYWAEILKDKARPEEQPILTPARLDAIFGQTKPQDQSQFSAPNSRSGSTLTNPAILSPLLRTPERYVQNSSPKPSVRDAATSNTVPLGKRSISSDAQTLAVQRTISPSPTLRQAFVSTELRKSVMEKNARSGTPVTPARTLHHLHDVPEPERATKWLYATYIQDSTTEVLQADLWKKYKKAFMGTEIPLMNPTEFVNLICSTFGTECRKKQDPDGKVNWVVKGIRLRTPPTGPKSVAGSDLLATGFLIKGASVLNPQSVSTAEHENGRANNHRAPPTEPRGMRLDSHPPIGSSTSTRERDYVHSGGFYKPSHSGRFIPFSNDRRRSRSPVRRRSPPPRAAPHGKQARQALEGLKEGPEGDSELADGSSILREFFATYSKLGRVTKKGNAFSEVEELSTESEEPRRLDVLGWDFRT